MRQAKEPFRFVTASYLIRIRPERAHTLDELLRGMHACSDASIFYHTFESLERHQYTAFSSDFAQWALAACNEARLAEHLAAVDIRECVSLPELREQVIRPVEDHLRQSPDAGLRPAFEPFFFCEAVEVWVPREEQATNLEELARGIERMSLQTLHHHIINSRLRLHLRTNDFSHWIEQSLEIPDLARRVNEIDIYMNTLEGVREAILKTLAPWVEQ